MTESRKPRFTPGRAITESPPATKADAQPVRMDEIELKADQLPSQMLPYPKGTVVVYRPYRWDEINYFSSSKISQTDVYRRILEGIETLGIEPYELTYMDFVYIALLRKISSLGTADFNIAFEMFDRPQVALLKQSDIVFDDLSMPSLPVQVRLGSTSYAMSPMTVGAYIYLCEEGLQDDDIAVMASCMVDLDFTEAFTLLRGLYGTDLVRLEKIDQMFQHGMQPARVRAIRAEPNPDYIAPEDRPADYVEDPDFPELETVEIREEVSVPLDSYDTLIFPASVPELADDDGIVFMQ